MMHRVYQTSIAACLNNYYLIVWSAVITSVMTALDTAGRREVRVVLSRTATADNAQSKNNQIVLPAFAGTNIKNLFCYYRCSCFIILYFFRIS